MQSPLFLWQVKGTRASFAFLETPAGIIIWGVQTITADEGFVKGFHPLSFSLALMLPVSLHTWATISKAFRGRSADLQCRQIGSSVNILFYVIPKQTMKSINQSLHFYTFLIFMIIIGNGVWHKFHHLLTGRAVKLKDFQDRFWAFLASLICKWLWENQQSSHPHDIWITWWAQYLKKMWVFWVIKE